MKRTPRPFLLALPLAAAALVAGAGPRGLAGEGAPAAPVADRAGGAEQTPDDAIAALVAFLEKGNDEKPRNGEKRRAEGREHDRRDGRRGGERSRDEREESGRRDEPRRGSRPGEAAPAERERAERERDRARAEHRPEGQPRPSGRRPFDDGPPRLVRPGVPLPEGGPGQRPDARRVAPLVRPQPRGPGMPMIPLTPAQPRAPHVAPVPPVAPHAAPNAAPPHAAPGAVVVTPPQVRAFAFQLGPDGVANAVPPGTVHVQPAPGSGLHGEITVQIDGGELKLQGVPGMEGPLNLGGVPGIGGPIQFEARVLRADGPHGPHGPQDGPQGDSHAQVKQLLDRILDKVNSIESRLGGPGAHGQPGPHGQPMHHPGPQPPVPPQHPGMPPHQAGPQLLHVQPGPQPGGVNPDEINRRFEEQARHLHGRIEEMAKRLAEQVQAGGGEHLKQAHQKLVEMHEKIQQAFQDIRRRFAEQQERIERLELEVKKLREELDRRPAGVEGAPRKPVSLEIVPVL